MEVPRGPLLVAPAAPSLRPRVHGGDPLQTDGTTDWQPGPGPASARSRLAAYLRGGAAAVGFKGEAAAHSSEWTVHSSPVRQARQPGQQPLVPGIASTTWPWETALVAMRPVLAEHHHPTSRPGAGSSSSSSARTLAAAGSTFAYYADRLDGVTAARPPPPPPLHEQLVRFSRRTRHVT